MATARLVATAYTVSNASYVTVTAAMNMYDNTSDTADYATIRGRAGRSSNSTYYCYLHGFNFSDVPSNATVTAFTVKIKGYRNTYLSTGASYRVRLCGSATNSAIPDTTCTSDWGTDTAGTVLTIPTGSLTWSDIVNYGSGFSIQLRLRNSSTSSSNYPYLYIYGAEIEVTYTMPPKHTVSATTTEQDIFFSSMCTQDGTTTYYSLPAEADEGTDVIVYVISQNDIPDVVVKDNGTDVTSSYQYDGYKDGCYNYYYTISNIQADHVISVERVAVSLPIRAKQNGSWATAKKLLVKQNGAWREGTIEVKQNGNWN